ncbi:MULTISPECIES: hypothetical protein [Pseudomonas]|uniref:Uncharacterized protein n=1 Tax=Pseudomonas aegrilactucae TaxID=2854028 RepID=A0A9Q3AD58_9PSED|nr:MULTISPECIES: hypothetical protein [Pseudomonas]MBC3410160.1 hypothetical protein [Pseudomonas sp. SWRI51]MBV6287119.1 hypothetical protein [Pseudomonas aegrilactucae]MDD2076715.1 hypothetical protein [Pseudomonas putida]WRW01889.1 hypothetical protein VPZ82_19415 [Pseudomonas putida]HDS1692666.1 hypothetical protein [Pseudomonas putida]
MLNVSACESIELPMEVVKAARIGWGVTIDAYLVDSARVGGRLTGLVYCDLSGVSADGMTVVTPPVRDVRQVNGYTLVRSVTGRDHYVIVSKLLERAIGES